MNLLFVGSGSGSWEIRGRQLGGALGARVTTTPTDRDFHWADAVVLVKRAGFAWAAAVHRAGKPLVWDALDFWPQPGANAMSEAAARAMLRAKIEEVRPTLFIGATEAMAEAGGGVCLPHHSRPSLTARPVRDRVRTVAYEGSPRYLGRWAERLSGACERRGWRFEVNPPDLFEADIVVAFRDGEWDGWMCRAWKSGVKMANAMAAGRPFVAQWGEGYTSPPGVAGVEFVMERQANGMGAGDLERVLDEIADAEERAAAFRGMTEAAKDYTLSAVAMRYRTLLASIL